MRFQIQPGAGASRAYWADRAGIWTSLLCVVHCLFTPILISFSTVLAHTLPSEEGVHRSLALVISLFGAVALLRGFRKHRRVLVLAFMGSGLGCIFCTAFAGNLIPSHRLEVSITFLGSALMISAHRLNHTFCKKCSCASKPA